MTSFHSKRPTDATHLGNSYSPDLRGRRDISIFCIDLHWRRACQPLPSIRITEATPESKAMEDTDELYTTPYGGRFPVLLFPEEAPAPLAGTARTFAGAYYLEGMNTPAHVNLGKRIDCFRAAELLYLHAIARGDLRAHVGLGHLYARDRCEGHYFDALKNNLLADLVLPEDQIRKKAYEHFHHAASLGDAEATYMLGDMLRDGCGCQVDLDGAYECYCRAQELLQNASAVTSIMRGGTAFRLGRALEEGEGCPFDFKKALQWYETAVVNLEDAVEQGIWQYNTELGQAKRGILRMRQELALSR
ncbi:MAG: sel1 repeat family protein [Eggerthellaceae bacterium]|nr:sel1 repeat family protein [Eggerthellaceae bacterium]